MQRIQPPGLSWFIKLHLRQDSVIGFYPNIIGSCSIFELVCFMFGELSCRFSNLYFGASREALCSIFAPRLELSLSKAFTIHILLATVVPMI